MELSLYKEDLRPEYKDVNPTATSFENFSAAAQKAIKLVGKAVYHEYGTYHYYNPIYPPVKEGGKKLDNTKKGEK